MNPIETFFAASCAETKGARAMSAATVAEKRSSSRRLGRGRWDMVGSLRFVPPSMIHAEPLIPIDRFEIFSNGLDHPECLAFDRDGNLWAGGEAGQIYRI